MNSPSLRPALLLAATALLAACDKKDDATPAVTVTAQTVSSLSAAGTTSTSGQPVPARHYTFYSLADGQQVAYTDSNSTKWDVAFRSTTILINGGSSGPGQGGAQVLSKLFSEVATAPTTGYAVDATGAPAIPTGSGKGWYNYNTDPSNPNVVTPIAGRVLAVRTATGKYAKLEIQSYYKDAPASPTAANASGYYTFRYVHQGSGTSFN